MKVTIELTADQVNAIQTLKLLEVYPADELCGNALDFYLRALLSRKLGREAAKELLPIFYEVAEEKAIRHTSEQIEIDRVVACLLADI